MATYAVLYRRVEFVNGLKSTSSLKKDTPDLHLTYSKNGGNQGLILNGKRGNFYIKSYVVAIY